MAFFVIVTQGMQAFSPFVVNIRLSVMMGVTMIVMVMVVVTSSLMTVPVTMLSCGLELGQAYKQQNKDSDAE